MNLEVELIAGVIMGGPPPKNLPAPRLIKIFIAGEPNEFIEERKQLLELVGPELQSIYDDMGIEVLLMDMQYATNANPDKNPYLAEHFLDEIHAAYRHSRGCFLLLLIGEEYNVGWVPTKLTSGTYELLSSHCDSMEEYYELRDDDDCYVLKVDKLETSEGSWQNSEASIREALKKAAEAAISEQPDNEEVKNILRSTAERQLEYALKLDETGEGVIAVTRSWKGKKAARAVASLKSLVNSRLPPDNIINVEVDQKQGGINPDNRSHKGYLAHLCRLVVNRVQNLVNSSIEADPEIKSKKKMVQEIYAESLMHLALLREVKPSEENENVERIKETLIAGKSQKHGPILIKGGKYSGKSSLLSRIYADASSWLDCATFRVVRLCASTPRSAYSLELLRVLCQHVGFLSGSLDGNLPQDASFDPLYLNNWLGQIMRRIEEEPMKEQLVILLDDLHRLHPLDCDIVAALSWLPLNLPPGVHLIVTTAFPPEVLRLTPVQKERLRSSEILIELQDPGIDFHETEKVFGTLERLIGERAANRIGAILASTEYGLSETEILEVIMPTGGDGPLFLNDGLFNFSTWCLVRRTFNEFLKVRVMSGRLLFSWRYPIRDLARKRYFPNQEILKSYHGELANLFFTEDFGENDDKSSPEEETPKKQTPFQSRPRSQDTAYNLRHVEEAWLHLLRAGDVEKLKKLAVCAFDFLLAAVQMISVSYLRCVLEHSRKYLLERDLELVYYTVRKSSDILTRDPLQLGAQLICWLRPVAEDGGDLVSRMVTAAMAWCDGYTAPLLVPLNGWLQPPLPLQIRTLSCPQGVKLVEAAPSGQHVIIVPFQGDAQLWHVMSGQLVHTFKGHSNPISCLAVTQHSQYLLTGSEDTSIIVWDMKELTLKLRIQEHIAPVLCLTSALKNSVIVSGGEDSRIIVTSLLTGDVLIKVDHHRGPVNSIRVDSAGEILVSGSSDCTVCLWCLERFTLLKSIVLPSAVTMLDVSADSVFLLAACEDQKLYLRSLATGTEIHTLRGHQGEVRSICLARDCRRAIAGGTKGKVSVFDMHSGRLTRTLPTNPSADVTAVKVTEKDDFLITASGDRVAYWSFRGEEAHTKPQKSMKEVTLHPHTAPISCLDISRDGAMAVTGGVDSLVNLWQLNTHELLSTFEGHIASVTCIAFSASGLFVASGSEDKTVRVWGLTLGLLVSTFKHQAPVTAVTAMFDGRRIISSDRAGSIRVWAADTATLIQSVCGPGRCFTVSSDMRYGVCGTGDNQLRIVSLGAGPEEKYQVSHSQEITCLVVTPDSRSLITGSRDMSLKVWQLAGGKLSQVLVGHTDHVTCVAVSVLDKSIVVSGSRDANLIVWDINTGSDLHTLKGHLGYITCVKLSGDGTLAASGSEDKSLIIWDTKKGCSLSSIMLHVPVLGVELATDLSRLALYLLEHKCMPILCLHNTPAQYVKLPDYVAPWCDTRDLRPRKRPNKRLLKKEVSLDSDTWHRKYGHLTSGILTSSVEDGLQRRFSVSASMDEISKVGLTSSPSGLGPEQAALAQSQHFDQLEALWNKQSPPARPRAHGRTLSKQSSLQATRISDSEEEGVPD
ncbi:NACHT domain- and WD repeat-containing protein 1 [Frieseomelitta varia]|uniref:NACHT domain- and WD repeat-containing protein 1 n=1 Tax=Frieseomelitta varia TaxID=561572 RepID=UPI001CB68C1D|nr:NACHT domain- and WD repeat-containing protein 1 [Frieseomelitta varia]XP_043524827.1 NACHT domain- and WD repeat-containing protein 1 [Frieseomelitta varia]XP_043524828.1 NACHT domain- and WD repeat-containing protein 1 [Frieseomelitta varia]XP_043524829.1 NACHT domain- and WD repeat-containing protein 1 [Frieseomelitta varia]XP_043524830.1 NACHT domain- and WD repeat-containing protein 1 [Frieseomelitta varia]